MALFTDLSVFVFAQTLAASTIHQNTAQVSVSFQLRSLVCSQQLPRVASGLSSRVDFVVRWLCMMCVARVMCCTTAPSASCATLCYVELFCELWSAVLCCAVIHCVLWGDLARQCVYVERVAGYGDS